MLIKKKIFDEIKSKLPESTHESEPQDSSVLSIGNRHFHNKDEVLEEAYKEAEEIINRSKREAEEILAASEEQVKEGVEKLVGDKLARLDELEAKAAEELASLSNFKRELLEESRPLVLEIATALASQLVNKKVKEDPTILENMFNETVESMLSNAEEDLKITFVVNPADLDAAKKYASKLMQRSAGNEIAVRDDETVAEGSCMLESSSGTLDLNFTSQLELFKEKNSL
jgi:flagellar assembly protein FliH